VNKYILKVGCVNAAERQVDELNFDIINRLALSYGGTFKETKNKAFKIPCCADCGDPSCDSNVECDLMEFEFFSDAKETPDNLARCHAGLTMFSPVVCAQTLNPNNPSDMSYYNRFDEDGSGEDDDNIMETNKKDLN
jgi:hypothetical protein